MLQPAPPPPSGSSYIGGGASVLLVVVMVVVVLRVLLLLPLVLSNKDFQQQLLLVYHYQVAGKKYSLPERMPSEMVAGAGWRVEVVRGSWAYAPSRVLLLVFLSLQHSAYLATFPSSY